MRAKDLVDLVLLVQTDSVDPEDVRVAVRATFAKRASHALPTSLPEPPAEWEKDFDAMAREAQLTTGDMTAAIKVLRAFWDGIRW